MAIQIVIVSWCTFKTGFQPGKPADHSARICYSQKDANFGPGFPWTLPGPADHAHCLVMTMPYTQAMALHLEMLIAMNKV